MAENDDPTPGPAEGPAEVPADPARPAVPADTTVEQTVVANDPAPVVAERPRFTDRLWDFRAMVAVALAALLLGGGIGAAIAAVSHDEGPDRHGRFDRFGDGPPGPFTGPGRPGFDPRQRQQFRDDLKDLRKKLREQRQHATPPTPSPTTPGPSSNG